MKVETVMVWPDAIDVLSIIMSVPDVPTVPCRWQVVPPLSLMRKCAAVPVPDAATDQVPDLALLPDDAAAIQSDGRAIVANSDPLSAVAQSAGADPVRIYRLALVPVVDSIVSNRALRTATDN